MDSFELGIDCGISREDISNDGLFRAVLAWAIIMPVLLGIGFVLS